MSHSDMHKQKKKKNFAILAMIAAFIILIWAITMIRIAGPTL